MNQEKKKNYIFSCKFSMYQTTLSTMVSILLSQQSEGLGWVFIWFFFFLREHDLEMHISYTNH